MAGEDGYRLVRNHAEFGEKARQRSMSNGNFPHENQDVENDQEIVDERRGETRLIVAKGNHSGFGNFVIGKVRNFRTNRTRTTLAPSPLNYPITKLPNYTIS